MFPSCPAAQAAAGAGELCCSPTQATSGLSSSSSSPNEETEAPRGRRPSRWQEQSPPGPHHVDLPASSPRRAPEPDLGPNITALSIVPSPSSPPPLSRNPWGVESSSHAALSLCPPCPPHLLSHLVGVSSAEAWVSYGGPRAGSLSSPASVSTSVEWVLGQSWDGVGSVPGWPGRGMHAQGRAQLLVWSWCPKLRTHP